MEATKSTAALPQIGEQWPGLAGVYAGVTTDKTGALYALVLMDEKPAKDLTWSKAVEWAKGVEADLPNRVEGALLFANLKDRFEPEWHWLNEQYSDSNAWGQDFYYGGQYYYYKSAAGRARAVRRLVLESFNPLKGASDRASTSSAALRAAAQSILAACDAADEVISKVLESA